MINTNTCICKILFFAILLLTAGVLNSFSEAKWEAMNSYSGKPDKVYCIRSMVHHEGILYVAGSFDSIGDIRANNIARWDGTHWDSLGAGMSDYVIDIAFDNSGVLYACGQFNKAGGVRANYIQDGMENNGILLVAV